MGGTWSMRGFLVAAAGAAFCLVPGASADESSLSAYRAQREKTAEELRKLALVFDQALLAAERNKAYESLLALDPDDAKARKALKYVREGSGWTRAADVKLPKSQPDKPESKDALRKLELLFVPYREAAARVRADTAVPLIDRERVLDEQIDVLPGDEEARAARREVRDGAAWVLEETAVSRVWGRELRASGARALAEVPEPQRVQPTAPEAAMGRVAEAAQSSYVRVVCFDSTSEAVASVKAVDAMHALLRQVLDEEPPNPRGSRALLFSGKTTALAAIRADRRFAPSDVKFAESLSGTWAPDAPDCYEWDSGSEGRVESVLRQMLGSRLRARFDVSTQQAWAWEGVGHWFSDVILQRHRCVFIRPTDYADPKYGTDRSLRDRLVEKGADWMAIARGLEASPQWPGLRVPLGRDVNTQTSEDLLVSYCLTRMLLEGRPGKLPGVLEDVGRRVPIDRWSAARLGSTVEGLERRLRRWIRESADR